MPIRERPDSGETATTTYFDVIAKLRRDVSRDAARGEMQVVAKQLAAIDRKAYGSANIVVRDEMLDRNTQRFMPLPSLFIAAGVFMLLIACTNVANLRRRAAHGAAARWRSARSWVWCDRA